MAAAPRASGLLAAALLAGPLEVAAGGGGGGGVASQGAVVTVGGAPAGAALSAGGRFPGLFADFSGPLLGGALTVWAPADLTGCVAYPLPRPAAAAPAVAVVRRGNCSYEQKALLAQDGGASGLVVVSDVEDVLPMGRNASNASSSIDIFVVSVTKSFGDALVSAAGSSGRPAASLLLSFAVYKPALVDASEAFIVLLATSMVVCGAWFSTADMRQGSPLAPRHDEEVVEVSHSAAMSFCVFGSLMLCVLFFLMEYLIWVIIFGFCVGGGQCLAQIGAIFLAYSCPRLQSPALTLPCLGRISRAELISASVAAAVVVAWFCSRDRAYSWPLQDIIGAGFLCMIQRTVRLPNMQVATVLLSMMFFFDIFWVFLSPLLFGKSVMVQVATGGKTHETVPMLFRIPKINDPFHSDNMLGFGDIAVPGLLVSLLRRRDILTGKRGLGGYFAPSVAGYAAGLCATLVALSLSRMGQPALLYLVPGTLGTTWALALRRGEASRMWSGAADSPPGDAAGAATGGYPLAAVAVAAPEAQGQELQRGLAQSPHGAA